MPVTPIAAEARKVPKGRAPARPARCLGAQRGGQPPACPPLDQVPQPRLGDPVEVQPGGRAVADSQVAQPPDVAGILGLPAPPVGQLVDLTAGESQQRSRGVVSPLRVLPGMPLHPGLFGQVQQGAGAAAGQERGHLPGHGGPGLDPALVVPALQHVLHLQPERGRKAAQVDALVRGNPVAVVTAGEPGQVRPAQPPPPQPVRAAQPGLTCAHSSQKPIRQLAGGSGT